MILVVGATGQLGSDVVRNLAAAGRPVRAFVREGSTYDDLAALDGVEIALGDLCDPPSIDAAMQGVTAVVATANAVAPRKGDSRHDLYEDGYADLLAAAELEGVQQFVLVSLPEPATREVSPEFGFKRLLEQWVLASPVPHTILRFPMFTEVWLAMTGSSIPERGEPRSPLQRPFAFAQRYRRLTGRMVEDRGRMLVPGPATNRHAFISVHDAGRIVAASVGHPAAIDQVLEIGGPEILDWNDVAARWSDVLGRRVRVNTTPRAVFRVNQVLMAPFAHDAANIMGMNADAARIEAPWEPGAFVKELDIGHLKTVDEVMREKLALPG